MTKAKLEVVLQGKLILKETKEDGSVEESELPYKACSAVINQLIQACVISYDELKGVENTSDGK